MNCTYDKEKLTGYYDGELDAAEKAEVERHIASCSECLRELGELKSAALLVKELPRLRAPRSIAEGVAREIQAAGKVHHFAKVRRSVLWACAAAAVVLVALNVVYFVQVDKSPVAHEAPLAAKATPTPSIANAPAPQTAGSVREGQADPAARRARALEDRGAEPLERSQEEALKKNKVEDEKKVEQKAAERAKEEPMPSRDKLAAAPTKPAPAPEPPAAALPPAAPKPGASAPPPAPVPAPTAKDDARPADLPAEKAAAARKDGELGKQDVDKKSKPYAEAPAEASPTHLTLVSTQMAKDRTSMDAALKKMGVALPPPPPAIKGMAAKAREESTISLELTDRQIARLQQELTKAGRTQLVYASPGDPVLQQYGDTGMLRKGVSGGAAAPAPRKAPEAPKAEAGKGAEPSKEAEESTARLEADKADKTGSEPKRKVVLHFMETTFMPDQQPAADPVKK